MARGIVFVVFLLPVIASIVFGSLVMAEVLKEPNRELKFWEFEPSGVSIASSDMIKISGIQKQYSTTSPIEIKISVEDPIFDCGDLYITIFDISSSPNQIVSQSGFFEQCFNQNNSILPINDDFYEIIDTPGNYQIVIEMSDKQQKKTIYSSAKFSVK